MRLKNDVSTLRYARSFERLQLRTSGFKGLASEGALVPRFIPFMTPVGGSKDCYNEVIISSLQWGYREAPKG